MLKVKCLVLDHDDTVVSSTRELGYPSFCEILARLRPGVRITPDELQLACFDPGLTAYCRDVHGFTDEEIEREEDHWREYVKAHMPLFFPGMADLIRRYKADGGCLCVVSQSHSETIRRDYQEQCGFEPDCVFGRDMEPEHRKPSPYPLLEIMRRFGVRPQEMLMIDDLKTGMDMANACGVPFACAGWAHELPQVVSFMKAHSPLYLESVGELEAVLFDE